MNNGRVQPKIYTSSTEDFTATSSCTSYSDPFQDKGGRISGSTSRIMDNYSSVHTCTLQNFIDFHLKMGDNKKQEESARERALCQLTECFSFVMVIMRGKHNYQGKGCTEIQ